MELLFQKYHGAGNDFIIVDNHIQNCILTTEQIKKLCDRHLGIGADGLMILHKSDNFSFKMQYFNSDGNEGTMCGNGGRAISAFAFTKGLFNQQTTFEAIDGIHSTKILSFEKEKWDVEIQLNDVQEIQMKSNSWFLNTGSPHHISFVKHVLDYDVHQVGNEIRWSKEYESINGTNVNFVEILKDGIFVRTFERGVEAETLSCGTGVTASAIAFCLLNQFTGTQKVNVYTKGGNLIVCFSILNNKISNVLIICQHNK